MTIAALYVDPRGPYPALPGVECWDEARNAKLYEGPHRVIAHPPCGPWGRLRGQASRVGIECGPIAVDQVRQLGGVLEHPAHSSLWKFCALPQPWDLFPDQYGGRTVEIAQGEYGHVAPKLTWLYFVGVGDCPLHRGWGHQAGRVHLQHSSARHFTPPDLAVRLVTWIGG